MLLRVILSVVFMVPLSRAADLPDLIQKLENTAVGESGITKAEDDIASEIQKVGAPAIPSLLALVKHKKPAVRTLAGYILRDIEGLKPDHMAPLVAGYRAGSKWLPPAIARTGNPDAAEFLIKEYFRSRQTYGQLDWAIELVGDKAVQPLVTAIRTQKKWDDSLRSCVIHIFKELGPKAKEGVPMLADLAKDERASEHARVAALSAMGAIGHDAVDATPLLNDLRRASSKRVRETAERALIGTGSPEGMALLLEYLRSNPDVIYLRDIAEHGERAKVIGAEVSGYLEHDNWDLRWGAARTLGFIGYESSAPGLITALGSPEDWRLVWAAAESLGRLRVASAKDALEAAAKDYWYEPVREAAKTALQALGGADPYAKQDEEVRNFYSQFFAHWDVGSDWERLEENDLARIRFREVQQKNVVSATRPAGPEWFSGIRVSDGQILGSDQGEWGGKLVHLDRRKKLHVLVPVNTHTIYGDDKGAIALTGLAHLVFNDGIAYKVEHDPQGKWIARKWRALPGAPRYSRLIENGAILALCTSGAVILSPDGTMKQLTRAELLEP